MLIQAASSRSNAISFRAAAFSTASFLAFAIGLAAQSAPAQSQSDQPSDPAAKRLAGFLGDGASRIPGSPANAVLASGVKRLFSSADRSGVFRFEAACIKPRTASISTADIPPARLMPLHPSAVNPGNLPTGDAFTQLVYLAPGSSGPADGGGLAGALVLCSFDTRWQEFAVQRPMAFIFIEPGHYTASAVATKMQRAESGVPMFMMDRGHAEVFAAAAAAAGGPVAARVKAAPTVWESEVLESPWAFMRGTDPVLERDVVVITAPVDCDGVLPGLASGGRAGANLYLLARMFESFRSAPPRRSVLLVAVNARSQAYLGDRVAAWHLLAPDSRWREMEALLVKEQKAAPGDAATATGREIEIYSSARDCRKAMDGRRVAVVLSLELDWQTGLIGFSSGAEWGGTWQTRFGRNSFALSRALQGAEMACDTMTRDGGMEEGYYFPGYASAGALAAYQGAAATPAFALRNVFSSQAGAGAPSDSATALPFDNVWRTMVFAESWLRAIMDDNRALSREELPPVNRGVLGKPTCWSGRIRTFMFDERSGNPLPTIAVTGAMVIVRDPSSGPGFDAFGNLTVAIGMSDRSGGATFLGLPWNPDRRSLLVDAFHFDPGFTRVDAAIDAGDVMARVPSAISSDAVCGRTVALFPCEAFTVFDRIAPPHLSAYPISERSWTILSGADDAPPRRYGLFNGESPLSLRPDAMRTDGPLTLYVEPDERVKLVSARGLAAVKCSSEQPEGSGYSGSAEMAGGFLAAAAGDMRSLAEWRLSGMKGVRDSLAESHLAGASNAFQALERTQAAHASTPHDRLLLKALGLSAKALRRVSDLRDDMLRAVVIYMALLLPFSFFLAHLLSDTERLERRIALFAVIFTCAFVVFRFVHPAFSIARSPEAMFAAFVMGALAVFVIVILYGRFRGEMSVLLGTWKGMSAEDVNWSLAGQHALLAGVRNMRRRRVRTALTTATIVVVTFIMLSFTSITAKNSPSLVSLDREPRYDGILYHWPGLTMDRDSAEIVRGLMSAHGKTAVRYWAMSPRRLEGTKFRRQPFRVTSAPSGGFVNLDAVLGLQPDDVLLEGGAPLAAGRFFSSNDAYEAVLPSAVAAALGIGPKELGNCTVSYCGRAWTVVGILDDAAFHALTDLDGRSLVPLQMRRRAPGQDDGSGELSQADYEGAGAEEVGISMMAVMPAGTLAAVGGGEPYSVAVSLAGVAGLWRSVEDLLAATDARFYIGNRGSFSVGDGGRTMEGGTYFVGAGYRVSVGGVGRLIIPLLVAVTIILNTMAGSVHERRREIAVYNAVGLNPNHVFGFFLAEAVVYGVVGAVGGYLAGQVLTVALNKAGLVSDVTLNYSSMSVAWVILLSIAVVVLSTLYPAWMATRAAVPSGKRRWTMPVSDGCRIETAMPFIYDRSSASAVVVWLTEYFERHGEAAFGGMVATRRDEVDATGGQALTYDVALAPVDLGVTQEVKITLRPDSDTGSWRLWITILRLSGRDSDWLHLNRPFMEELRRRLMRFRGGDEENRKRD